MPQFDRNYSALGYKFQGALDTFIYEQGLREEAADALKAVFADAMSPEQVGQFVEFVATYFTGDAAQAALAESMAAEKAGWAIRGLTGYGVGRAKPFPEGWGAFITPSNGFNVAQRAEVLKCVGKRYHLRHDSQHFGLTDNVFPNGNRGISVFLYGAGEEAEANAARWVLEGPDVASHRLDDFCTPLN